MILLFHRRFITLSLPPPALVAVLPFPSAPRGNLITIQGPPSIADGRAAGIAEIEAVNSPRARKNETSAAVEMDRRCGNGRSSVEFEAPRRSPCIQPPLESYSSTPCPWRFASRRFPSSIIVLGTFNFARYKARTCSGLDHAAAFDSTFITRLRPRLRRPRLARIRFLISPICHALRCLSISQLYRSLRGSRGCCKTMGNRVAAGV